MIEQLNIVAKRKHCFYYKHIYVNNSEMFLQSVKNAC